MSLFHSIYKHHAEEGKLLIIPSVFKVCPHFLTVFLFCSPFFLLSAPLLCLFILSCLSLILFSPHLFLGTHHFSSSAILSLSFRLPSLPLFFSVLLCCGCCFPPLQNLPQVKQVQALRQVKERLQAENRALSRVLAKLSQSACSQLPTVDL